MRTIIERAHTIDCWACMGTGTLQQNGENCPRCTHPSGVFSTGKVKVVLADEAATVTPEQVEAGRAAVAEFMACAYCSDGSCGDCTGTVLAVVRAMGFEVLVD